MNKIASFIVALLVSAPLATIMSWLALCMVSDNPQGSATNAMTLIIVMSSIWLVLGIYFYRAQPKKLDGLVAIAIAMMSPPAAYFVGLPVIQASFEQQVAICDKVYEYGSSHFAELDKNSNKVIEAAELRAALEKTDRPEADIQMLRQMSTSAASIGHVTESYLIGDAAANEYGISREDIKRYPEKIRLRLKYWNQ